MKISSEELVQRLTMMEQGERTRAGEDKNSWHIYQADLVHDARTLLELRRQTLEMAKKLLEDNIEVLHGPMMTTTLNLITLALE